MNLIKEALAGVKRLDPEEAQPVGDDLDLDLDLDDDTDLPSDETINPESQDDQPEDDLDLDLDDDTPPQSDPSQPNPDAESPWGALPAGEAPGGEDQPEEQGDVEGDPETSQELDAVADRASQDPDRQGLIRTVKGAHLVYKRESDSGTYEELWIYNVTTLQDEMQVRKAILAGTDIPPNKATSPDGSQTYKVWSAGNAEMLLISGLQN